MYKDCASGMWCRRALRLGLVLLADRLYIEQGRAAAAEITGSGTGLAQGCLSVEQAFAPTRLCAASASAPSVDRMASTGTSFLVTKPAAAFRARSLLDVLGSAFVFVAGLEGTGHHMMGAIFDKLAHVSGGCIKNRELSHAVAQYIFPNGNGNVGDLQRLLSEEAAKAAHGNQLVALNVVSGLKLPGMMSYPDFSMHSTSPNITALQMAVNSTGSRLRVLVTTRSTKGTLQSGCVHHKWSGPRSTCRDQALRLKAHGQALVKQLRTMPQGAALCLSYEDFLDHRRDVSHFLGKDLASIMEELYKPRSGGSMYDTEVQESAHLLDSTIQELEEFCASAQRISAVELLGAIATKNLGWLDDT